MENTGAPDARTLVALNDDESRIGVRNGRFFVQAGFERHPVNEVTWNGARRYCAWRGARLPTEAEWEAAARGREGRRYPWGSAPPDANRAVFGRRSNETGAAGERAAGATPEGVHDLAGNVAEWTSSLYRPYPYRAEDDREDADAPGERVTRGGDHVFDSTAENCAPHSAPAFHARRRSGIATSAFAARAREFCFDGRATVAARRHGP
jgi:iron(II)-dependent oxidoreductase